MSLRFSSPFQSCLLLTLSIIACVSSVHAANTSGFCEFDSVNQAAAFGWQARSGAELKISNDAKDGKSSLEAIGKQRMKPYGGLDLTTSIDLTKAAKGDQLIFDVRQNFTAGIWVNINGAIYRNVSVPKDKWTHVALNMDLADWQHSKDVSAWPVLKTISFYQKTLDGAEKELLIDGLQFVINGNIQSPQTATVQLTNWNFPYQTDDAWLIGDAQSAWAISKKSGEVLGGWNTKTKEQYLQWNAGRYYMQDAKSTFIAKGEEDEIKNIQFNSTKQQLQLSCINPALNDITIEKLFSVENGKLIKQIRFATSQSKQLFITYNNEVSLVPAYRDNGYYFGAGTVGPLVPAPKITSRQTITQYRSSSKGMVLSQSQKGYSFADYRYKIDQQFVWPWWEKYSESSDVLTYTPTGWEMSLGTLSLTKNRAATYEEHLGIFPGTWFDFLSNDYSALPEVQKERANIPKPPKWLDNVKLEINPKDLETVRQTVKTYQTGDILVLLNPQADWSDYFPDQPHHGNNGGFVSGPELKKLIDDIRAISPRLKVGLYHFDTSALDVSPIYKSHPEWFRKFDKQGNAVNLFPGLHANYASMINNQGLYDNLLDQFKAEMDYYHVDFINLDESKTTNLIDWKTNGLTTDYQWQQFWLEMNRNAKQQNPDSLLFFNGRGNPYAGLNYIEARSQLRPGFWHDFAGIGLAKEVFMEPHQRIIPLYLVPGLAQSYLNRTLALGWIPKLENSDILRYRPFVTAAFQIGNTTPVDAQYTPDWKRDPDSDVESYVVRRDAGQERLLSLISHEKKARTVPITIDTKSLGFNTSQNLYIWGYRIADATNWKDAIAEQEAQDAFAKGGWQLDRITIPELLYSGAWQPQLKLDISLNPDQLYMVSISTQPAAIYSENNMAATFRFASSRLVNINSNTQANSISATIDAKSDSAKVLFPLPDKSTFTGATVDGKSVNAELTQIGNVLSPIISIAKGIHKVSVAFADSPETRTLNNSEIKATVNADFIDVTLPAQFHSAKNALITVTQDTKVLLNRSYPILNGVSKIPLAAQLNGTYQIEIKAIENTQWIPIQSNPVKVTVQQKEVATAPSPTSTIAGKLEINNVDKTIKGIRILRQASETTATPDDFIQQGMPALTANANAENLILSAGTTRKTVNFTGAAFAGFEVDGIKQVKVLLQNTYYDAFSLRGGINIPDYTKTDRFFAGIMLNYHTAKGYTKKVALGVGVLAPDCGTVYPTYAAKQASDQIIDLGAIIDKSAQTTLALDLTRYAPSDWDGKLWFSVGSDYVAANRRLTAQILSVNKDAGSTFIEGNDPKQLEKLYHQPRQITIPKESQPPMIDGVNDEEIWKAATEFKPLYLLGGKGIPTQSTKAIAYYDKENLYMQIICQENQREKPLTGTGAIWHDDEVEIWMDTNRDGKTYKQLIINAAGDKLEMNQDGPTKIGAQAAAKIEDGRWIVEVAIPFKALGIETPKPGDIWKFNFVRQRPGGGNIATELTTWSPLDKAFNELQNFATLTFGK